ncbi:MAG: flagellar basal body L-ring protein FlgH [Hyphomonadaceae bacterium]|nr:flagellar basal body L-ring protein FlgH [Hyphomonadaceae bacterium]
MRVCVLLVLGGLLAGCATVEDHADTGLSVARDGARRIGRAATGPHLAPVADPSPLAGVQTVSMPMPSVNESVQAPNSLWKQGARTFFNDQRATRIGDILTVKISIDDSAEIDNTTSRNRSGSSEVGVTSLFGKQDSLGRLLPPGGTFDPASMVGADGSSRASGTGTISRQEKIDLTLAASIAQVLPNGNLVVAGRQEVRINGELRELTVAGVVRPEDIGADNSIRHDQLAEARISYGGRGTISTVQKPRWGQRVTDAISPW